MVKYYGEVLWWSTMVKYYGEVLWWSTMVKYYGEVTAGQYASQLGIKVSQKVPSQRDMTNA